MRIAKKMLLFYVLLLLALPAGAAGAAGEKTFAVLPFAVNGPQKYDYLGKTIPDMLSTRLYWQGHFHSLPKSELAKIADLKDISVEKAKQVIDVLGVDYLIYGGVTILGEESSLDIQIRSKDGQAWPKAYQTSVNKLIPTLDSAAKQINAEVFRKVQAAAEANPEKIRVNAMNPGLVFNEADKRTEYYLNPQFRYSGDAQSEGRLKSHALPITSIGMLADDFDGDGVNEIIILDDHTVHAFRMDQEAMTPIATYSVAMNTQLINVSAIDMNRDGLLEIVLSAADRVQKGRSSSPYYDYSPSSLILNLRGGKFELVQDNIRLFLNVVKTPPEYMPTLVGQRKGDKNQHLFAYGVHKVSISGGKYELGGRLLLPSEANVYNFCYLPQGDKYKVVMTDERDKLRVYTPTGDRQHTTDKVYSGSGLGLEYDPSLPGMHDPIITKPMYYVPIRMIPFNLDGDDRYELLVNHPVSVASMFFERYRFYPQGEIHTLYWDGVGLNLVWKTRRIKGSVIDYGLKDINNDGVLDLYVCLNTHPGALGVKRRRTIILAYPLDTTKTDAEVDESFKSEDN